jgi:DNA-binding winged helix-turn-helix (wHTH) protein
VPLNDDTHVGRRREFGRFRLHRRDRMLLANGLKPDLGVRAIDVLLDWIDADGTMVTKDALLDQVCSGIIGKHHGTKTSGVNAIPS